MRVPTAIKNWQGHWVGLPLWAIGRQLAGAALRQLQVSFTPLPKKAWDMARASLCWTIFPQLTLWLPEDEAAQLRLAFDSETERLQSD